MSAPLDLQPQPGPYRGLTIRSAKRLLTQQFAAAALPFADEDALDLLLGITGLSQSDYVLRGEDDLPAEQLESLKQAATRRLSGEPVDRILGCRDFYGRRFAIDNVLSPRGDTEVLLLAALGAVKDTPSPSFIDLGTGSGALAVSLLCERPDSIALAIDNDTKALATAQHNAEALGVTDRLSLLQSDWLSDIPAQQVNAILSNPPYITTQAIGELSAEVADHDPATALHGGADGLDPYRIIIPNARDYLCPGGWLGVEIGYDQGQAVSGLFRESGYNKVRLLTDPAGLDRVVCGHKPA